MKSRLCCCFLTVLCYVFSISDTMAQRPFVTTWSTTNAGVTTSTQVAIPASGTNYLIEWEEIGDPDNRGSLVGNNVTIVDFPKEGIYRVSISGDLRWIRFNMEGDMHKLISIEQWGDVKWESMVSAFAGCEQMVCNATDAPDLSMITTLENMFRRCYKFKGCNLDSWDVSGIIDFSQMFFDARIFNEPLNQWNVSSATKMYRMFNGAKEFDQPLNSWDVSSVTTMTGMFSQAWVFNQNINSWDVSAVENMSRMFYSTNFNQPLDQWDVSSVTNMYSMFGGAYYFNQDISNWDVSNVLNFIFMFTGAWSFDHSLGRWQLNPNMPTNGLWQIFNRSGMSCRSYDNTLIGWAASNDLPRNIDFFFLISNPLSPRTIYWLGADARDTLIQKWGWTFEGDVFDTCNYPICYPVPAPAELIGDLVFCEGDSLEIYTPEIAARYHWFRDGEPVPDEHHSHLVVSQSGLYAVSYEEPLGCESERSEELEIIKISKDQPPHINFDDRQVIRSLRPGCEGYFHFEPEIVGCVDEDELRRNSSWKIGLHNSGQFDIFSTGLRPDLSQRDALAISESLPFGTHLVQWNLKTDSGVESEIRQLLTFVDKNPPVAVCIHGIAASLNPSAGELMLPARVFNRNSRDDCTTDEELQFSFSSDLNHTHHSWNCDDLNGQSQATFDVELWVTNQYGHQNFCRTYLTLRDNHESCPPTGSISSTVSGQVYDRMYQPIEDASLSFHTSENKTIDFQSTDRYGNYQTQLPNDNQYRIQAEISEDLLTGISTLDIVRIQQHILGLQYIEDPYLRIAADVNGDGKIDAMDVSVLREVVLGNQNSFPGVPSVRLIADYPLNDGEEVPSYHKIIETGLLQRDQEQLNFIAIKTGDVSGRHLQNGLLTSQNSGMPLFNTIEPRDRVFEAGERVRLDVTAGSGGIFNGVQGTLEFDPNFLTSPEFKSGIIDILPENIGNQKEDLGLIAFSWSTPEDLVVNGSETLFSIEWTALQRTKLPGLVTISSTLIEAGVYPTGAAIPLNLSYRTDHLSHSDTPVLYQNKPNPFSDQTTIEFYLPYPDQVQITLFSTAGQRVLIHKELYVSGHHDLTIPASQLGSSGIYQLVFQTGKHLEVRRLVVVE